MEKLRDPGIFFVRRDVVISKEDGELASDFLHLREQFLNETVEAEKIPRGVGDCYLGYGGRCFHPRFFRST